MPHTLRRKPVRFSTVGRVIDPTNAIRIHREPDRIAPVGWAVPTEMARNRSPALHEPAHLCRFDFNADGNIDPTDVNPFVAAMIAN